jgi:hypothetical protein
MSNSLRIKRISASNFVLRCEFSDGTIIDYNMADIHRETGPIAKPLKDPSYFAKVFLESGVPTWPNGYDVCPNEIIRTGSAVKAHQAF